MKVNVDVLTLTATPIPRTLGDEPGRHPRPVAAADAAGRSPADPHVRRRVRRTRRGRVDPPRAAPRGPGVLGAQPGAVDRAVPPSGCASSCPRRASPSPTGRWTRARSSRSCVDFWEGRFDVLVCTTIIESGIDMPTVNTLVVERADLLGLGQMHQLRGRVGRSGSRAYAYLFYPAETRSDRGGLRAAEDHRRGHRPRQRVQDRDARPRDPRRRQPARRGAERAHRRGRLRPLLPDGHRGRQRDEGRTGEGAERGEARRARPTPTCPRTTCRRRSCASRPTAASPASTPRRRSTTSATSGRTATAPCRRRPRRC